jgi:hypothetical protein
MRVKLSEFRAAKTWGARDVGISGLGTNPTNPWCQRPRRPPLQTCAPVQEQDQGADAKRGKVSEEN